MFFQNLFEEENYLVIHVDMDTENKVLTYGIGIILLNVGMYFVLPVAALLTFKRYVVSKLNIF